MSWQRPNIGSRVTREGHARFWERPEVKFLRATRQGSPFSDVRITSAFPPIATKQRTFRIGGFGPVAEIGLLDLSILARHNSTCVRATTSVCRCYGDLHATMASGGVRLATEGGAKMAR
jgi:hypothetical protein